MNEEFKQNLKNEIETNPAWALGAAAALLMGLAKLWDSKTRAKYARNYQKEINRRVRNSKRK